MAITEVAIHYYQGSGDTSVSIPGSFTCAPSPAHLPGFISMTFDRPILFVYSKSNNYSVPNDPNFEMSEVYFPVSVVTEFFAYDVNNAPSPEYIKGFKLADRLDIRCDPNNFNYTQVIDVWYAFDSDGQIEADPSIVQTKINELQGNVSNLPGDSSAIVQQLIDALIPQLDSLNTNIFNLVSTFIQEITALINNQNANQEGLLNVLSSGLEDGLNNAANTFINALTQQFGIPADLAGAIINGFVNLIKAGIQEVTASISGATSWNGVSLHDIVGRFFDNVKVLNGNLDSLLNDIVKGKYKSMDDMYSAIKRLGGNSDVIVWLQNIFTVFWIIIAYLKVRTASAAKSLTYLQNATDQPEILGVNEAISAYFRNNMTKQQTTDELHKHGLSDIRINTAIEVSRPLLSLADAKFLYLHNKIDETQHDNILSNYGLSPGTIQFIKYAYELIPSPTDITRLADKHIFSGDINLKFGQYDEMPQDYIDAMKQWGIDPSWTRKLWAAHWSLPGIQQGFDMFHRGIITYEELNIFLNLTDILPFFRDKLINLAYNPIGRVDIRRFYAVGVYNQSDVYNAYIKLGYSPEDAQKQTNFTVENERLSEESHHTKIRDLSVSVITKAVLDGVIDTNTALNRLMSLGYLRQDADLILRLSALEHSQTKFKDKSVAYHDRAVSAILTAYSSGLVGRNEARSDLLHIGVGQTEADLELYYAELERIIKLKAEVVKTIKTAYAEGKVATNEISGILTNYGFGINEVQLIEEQMVIENTYRSKSLTLTQIKDFFNSGIIGATDVTLEVKSLGYSIRHTNWIVAWITGE